MIRNASRSRHKYLPNPKYLFEDSVDEDEDDEIPNYFRSRFPYRRQSHSKDREEELQSQRQLLIDRQCEIEKRTLESTTRSLGLLYNSEDMGVNAAQELINQREILDKSNKKLEETKPLLGKSKKYIGVIKSIKYSIKNNMFGKHRHVTPHCSEKDANNAHGSGKLEASLNKFAERSEPDSDESHPSIRLRESEHHVQIKPATSSRQVDSALETNLTEIGHVISRLKDLGLAIGEEIKEQNVLIDTMVDNVDQTELKICDQTKMIKEII